jgi:hypothetical protein
MNNTEEGRRIGGAHRSAREGRIGEERRGEEGAVSSGRSDGCGRQREDRCGRPRTRAHVASSSYCFIEDTPTGCEVRMATTSCCFVEQRTERL